MESYKKHDFEEKARSLEVFQPGLPINYGDFQNNNGNVNDALNSQISPIFGDKGTYQFDAPVLTGSFNDWEEPQKMMRVHDFTAFVDKQKTEYIKML